MSRIKLKKKDQIDFLDNIRKSYKLNWSKMADILDAHYRSLSDWKSGKYTLPDNVFAKCIKLAKGKIKIPPYKTLPNFWNIKKAAKKGGLVVSKKYGGPGTPEGRKKGGQISQIKRRLNPELYQNCNIRKDIQIPKDSVELAEFFGIVLGDGGINNDYQVVITLHKENGKDYIIFVFNLIKKLFKIEPIIYNYRSVNCKRVVGVTVSSVSLIEFLLSKGLKKGSKVKNQIDVPKWIKEKKDFSKSCLRGLIDTDGGVYYHKHNVNGNKSFNIGLQFSNRSFPLIKFVKETLFSIDFNPKVNHNDRVNLYRESEVIRYAKEVRFNNEYHFERVNKFIKLKYKERCAEW